MHGVDDNCYAPGEQICGDLKELGWVVFRGVQIDEKTKDDFHLVANIGTKEWFGHWHPASTGPARKMKYKASSVRPTIRKNENLLQFQTNIEKMLNTMIVTKDMPKDASYKLGKINMLMSNGIDNNNGQPQKAYPTRFSL